MICASLQTSVHKCVSRKIDRNRHSDPDDFIPSRRSCHEQLLEALERLEPLEL